MRRILAGGLALAFAGAGAIFFAAPTSAQEDIPELSADLAPNPVEPGGAVTVTSIDPCPDAGGTHDRAVAYFLYDAAGNELATNEVILEETAEGTTVDWEAYEEVGDDGSWSYEVDVPTTEGGYALASVCYEDVGDEPQIPVVPVPVNPCEIPETDVANEGNPSLCYPVVNPCMDQAFADENTEACPDGIDTETNPCLDEETGELVDPSLLDFDSANCFDWEPEEYLNPCTEGLVSEDLCSVNLCETEEGASDERCSVLVGIAPTAFYFNEFTVGSPISSDPEGPTAPPAVPVPAEPEFTG